MRVILTRPYACAPDGHTVIRFETGEVLVGRVAEMAIADGAAIETQEMAEALETKGPDLEPLKPATKRKPRKA